MSKNTVLFVVLAGIIISLFVLSKFTGPGSVSTAKPTTKTTAKSNSKTTTVAVQNPTSDRSIDINDVVIDPPVYSDLTLTLDGRINDWVTKNTFTYTPIKSNFASSGKVLPVINRYNFKLPENTPESDLALGEVANIRVTGKIVIFDRASIESQWKIDLDDKMVDRWNKGPVILVDKIEKLK